MVVLRTGAWDILSQVSFSTTSFFLKNIVKTSNKN